MAQLRTVPPRWLWHRDLRPCAPGHFGLLHKKPERFHIQIIMWLEVPLPHTDYYVTWSSAVPLPLMDYSFAWSSASEYRIMCDLELWNGAIRFRTRKILWLGSYAVTLPYNKFSTTWSFAVSLPYKSFDFKSRSTASAQRISCDLKFRSFASAQGIYYVSKFSSSAFANRQSVTWSSSVSHNILWLEFPQFRFRKKRRHLKFRTSAFAWEHFFSLENPLSFNHPPIS